jgi:hypothetical protein
MAIVNGPWRQGEFVPPGAEPGLTRTFMWRDIEQEQATVGIARARFDFPDKLHPTLRTYTNRPARQIGVRLEIEAKELVFPDIVVVEDPSNEVKMIGEVETHRSLRETPEDDLVEKWRTFLGLSDLFLFVPPMRVEDVKQVLKRHQLRIAGLRAWRYITGQGLIDIVDVR